MQVRRSYHRDLTSSAVSSVTPGTGSTHLQVKQPDFVFRVGCCARLLPWSLWSRGIVICISSTGTIFGITAGVVAQQSSATDLRLSLMVCSIQNTAVQNILETDCRQQ